MGRTVGVFALASKLLPPRPKRPSHFLSFVFTGPRRAFLVGAKGSQLGNAPPRTPASPTLANAVGVGLSGGCDNWLAGSILASNLYVRWVKPIGAFRK